MKTWCPFLPHTPCSCSRKCTQSGSVKSVPMDTCEGGGAPGVWEFLVSLKAGHRWELCILPRAKKRRENCEQRKHSWWGLPGGGPAPLISPCPGLAATCYHQDNNFSFPFYVGNPHRALKLEVLLSSCLQEAFSCLKGADLMGPR